ncbi:MAG: branched-chain amino acid transport system II carrier protein [Puniceicoccales bacterium]|jgi:LIVCS family branched-chain amino acid:cation transporter|nr:branched-chain amino acid transport system II carrier protein [Puniceicoccales bacterium]
MKKCGLIFTYGFALFGMFFGAGNLVFPLKIGQIAGENWLCGFLGLAVTGVILPFLGLFVIKLQKGNYHLFFGGAGDLVKLFLPLFSLSLMAAFGGMPRCITVAYGGLSHAIPELSINIFSLIFCAVAFFVCLKEQRIIHMLGKWMTPILLVFFVTLIALGMIHHGKLEEVATVPGELFLSGLVTGYQTMDLLAAFFFSALIFTQIRKTIPAETSDGDAIKIAIKSSILAAFLLMVVYAGMTFLGASFSNLIKEVKPASMLVTISKHVLGNYAALFVSVAIIIACFTTVVALNNIYAQYLCSLFKLKQNKFEFVLLATTTIAFVVSLFDFDGIAKFLLPILEVSYPSLIALTVVSLFSKKQSKLKITLFYGMLLVVLVHKITA